MLVKSINGTIMENIKVEPILITTLFPFLNNEWALHSAVEPVEYEGFIYDIAGKKYSELEEELQDIIKNYRFTVQAIENYTMEEAETENAGATANMDALDNSDNTTSGVVADSSLAEDFSADESKEG